jgi:hypothetical protein
MTCECPAISAIWSDRRPVCATTERAVARSLSQVAAMERRRACRPPADVQRQQPPSTPNVRPRRTCVCSGHDAVSASRSMPSRLSVIVRCRRRPMLQQVRYRSSSAIKLRLPAMCSSARVGPPADHKSETEAAHEQNAIQHESVSGA